MMSVRAGEAWKVWTSALLFGLAFAGCKSSADYRAEADEAVYALVDGERGELFDLPPGFTIEPPEGSLRERLIGGERIERSLTLVELLEIASENSREYQDQKEALYRSALALTRETWEFETQGFGSAVAAVDGEGTEADVVAGGASGGLMRALGTGGTIVASLGTSLFRVVSTGDGWDAMSDISLAFTQPLLRGAGKQIALEPLTQAERNLVYEVRDFERFRRAFAVTVARQMYALLESTDALGNERENLASLTRLRERNESLAEAGRLSDVEADQASQRVLTSQNRLLQLRGRLGTQTDEFKLFLGLPMSADVHVDPREFERLTDEDPLLDGLAPERPIDLALANRLDLRTTLDELEDRERQAFVLEDALRAGLALVIEANSATDEGQPVRFKKKNTDWSLGLALDLPIERLIERNAWRSSLIALEAQERAVEELSDQIQLEIRNDVRDVADTRASYVIQLGAVTLAERRVESAALMLQAGRAETRDLLDAQADLLDAQNAATRALITLTLTRLDFYLDMELLRIDEDGIHIDESLASVLTEEDQ
ncbi:MAG: TolC family protein [Planctomycetota bacterium]|nr:MAG: TolC family protein [Planctomycetota bacterium]